MEIKNELDFERKCRKDTTDNGKVDVTISMSSIDKKAEVNMRKSTKNEKVDFTNDISSDLSTEDKLLTFERYTVSLNEDRSKYVSPNYVDNTKMSCGLVSSEKSGRKTTKRNKVKQAGLPKSFKDGCLSSHTHHGDDDDYFENLRRKEIEIAKLLELVRQEVLLEKQRVSIIKQPVHEKSVCCVAKVKSREANTRQKLTVSSGPVNMKTTLDSYILGVSAGNDNIVTDHEVSLSENSTEQIISETGLHLREDIQSGEGTSAIEESCNCDACSLKSSQSCVLKTPKRLPTGEKPYKCEVCGVGYAQNGSLKTHMRIHTGEKPYKCDICDLGFYKSGNLTRHRMIHTGEKPFKCDVCGQGFTQKGGLKTHLRIHTGEKPYKCNICEAKFSDGGKLNRHKIIHTGLKPYKCDICGVGFTQNCGLKKHRNIHTGEKSYECDVCGVRFSENVSLIRHKRIHTGEKPYKCDICGIGFNRSGYLKTHNRVHTGERPYKCDVCGRGFIESGGLKIHKRMHTGERPYKCDICTASFYEKGKLKRHKTIHTGQKSSKCDVCGLGVIQNNGPKSSRRVRTGDVPYGCTVCGVWFPNREDRPKKTYTDENLDNFMTVV